MSLFKNIFILSLSFFLFSCGGGGGGGGSSASPAATVTVTPTYNYESVLGDYTNKTWDAKTQMRRSIWNGNTTAWGGIKNSFGDYPLTITITEGLTNFFDISISGDLSARNNTEDYVSTSVELRNRNVWRDPLYNLDGDAVAVLWELSSGSSRGRSSTFGVIFLPEGLSSLANIKYTNVGFLDHLVEYDVGWVSGPRSTFAFNYGSKTVSGDMPSSGSATYNIDAFLMLQAHGDEGGYYYTTRPYSVSQGAGSLNANFSTGSIDGELIFSRYFFYEDFRKAGKVPTNQIQFRNPVLNPSPIPIITVSLSNGNLNTNDFTGAATINSDGLVGSGFFQGSFFGNNANETSGTFLLGMEPGEDRSGANYWDIQGVFIGCKASGC